MTCTFINLYILNIAFINFILFVLIMLMIVLHTNTIQKRKKITSRKLKTMLLSFSSNDMTNSNVNI